MNYRVSFVTKKGGYRNWVIDISARNAKEAKEIAKETWPWDKHMFQIEAKRIPEIEYERFRRVNWIVGPDGLRMEV